MFHAINQYRVILEVMPGNFKKGRSIPANIPEVRGTGGSVH